MLSSNGTKFVLLTSQRSGSAWLTSLLNQFEDTTAYSELFFHNKRHPGTRQFWDSNFIYPRFVESEQKFLRRPFSVISYLDQLYQKPDTIGFTLMYSQTRSYPEIFAYLIRNKIHVIHLVRKNHLDVEISLAFLKETKHAHPTSNHNGSQVVQLNLDPNVLIKRMKKLRKNINLARKTLKFCRIRHIEIEYEDLLQDISYLNLIADFLSIKTDGELPSSHLVKIRRGGHKDIIQNYTELKTSLLGTQFEDLIE